MITDDDVAAVERNRDLRADITSAFHDTLNLDPRYNVIANVLAHHAFRVGLRRPAVRTRNCARSA